MACPAQPDVLQKIAAHWVGFAQREGGGGDIVVGAQAEKVAKGFVAAQFLEVQAEEAQGEGEKDYCVLRIA